MTAFSFDDYQEATGETAVYPDAGEGTADALSYVILGLVGEAGEIANKFKKILRDQNGELTNENITAICAEAGDVQWYLARLFEELGEFLGDAAENNIAKLQSRKSRNKLQGSGDNR